MNEQQLPSEDAAGLLAAVRARTPARVLAGRSGPAYRTATQLELRCDHAFARDAVNLEFDLVRDLGADLVNELRLFVVETCAGSKAEFLLRPDDGRRLNDEAKEKIRGECIQRPDLQIIIGDGLSVAAVAAQVPRLLPSLLDAASSPEPDALARAKAESGFALASASGSAARNRGWSVGQPFAVRHCRVGVLNEVGALLDPAVVVLLIGERPGLATAESLSAYMAYRPRPGHTDAQRNLISNIHARGVSHEQAVQRIVALAEQMMRLKKSGVEVKEELQSSVESPRTLPSE